ncbi:heat-inducible transcription repressor HrcA [Dissulfurirhabdus thermomarina]|uniref:Heat-inducible transcription repressor HrcA n=1 Tax=Dissulfurirhabdus thermomarina TaxID=1765737 RepID=A0A6N9TQB0_DISTH|nr:heat-inducible transcriptional repressor HrcA [Dissulfurirhabdus thermomarina]NDY43369.1 heat-inducible transcription repressor HrcA [Dissulfurirhabdus thermomarina]NMX23649.1 heat-inducible transcription repressor HrcA [Dissulfurirhabdus thermomarina]
MTAGDGQALTERQARILRAVVQGYIETAEPVGSRTVARRSGLGLSPATIRNVMADLEDLGCLFQPHASAGRLPTEAGFRYYVEFLLEPEDLSWGDQVAIEKELLAVGEGLVPVLKRAARVLADVSGQAALVSVPRVTGEGVRHVEIFRVRPGLAMVVIVSASGVVRNRLVRLDHDLPEERLRGLADSINARLGELSLEEIRRRVRQEMEDERRELDALLDELVAAPLQAAAGGDVLVGGKLNLLDAPEFSTVDRIRRLLRAFEDKESLLAILDGCLEAKGVQVLIGAGPAAGLPGCAVVMTPYAVGHRTAGSLGVVGPVRMNYARMKALVEYTAAVLSHVAMET